MKYDVVIVASGVGKRSGLNYNKAFYRLQDGQTILEKTMHVFLEDKDCQQVIVVLAAKEKQKILPQGKIKICCGGKQRMDSVANGLALVQEEYVMIHDGARPLVSYAEIEALKKEVIMSHAVILGYPVRDSLKLVTNGYIQHNVPREDVYVAQTPQVFETSLLRKAFQQKEKNCVYTDESSVCESLIKVKMIPGSLRNFKVTYPEDLSLLEYYVNKDRK